MKLAFTKASHAAAATPTRFHDTQVPKTRSAGRSNADKKPTGWSKFKHAVGQTCLSALTTPARMLGCGPSRHDLFAMRLEADLERNGLGHHYNDAMRHSRPNVKKARFVDCDGNSGKSEKLVWSQPFACGGDGEISIVGLGNQHCFAAKSFFSQDARMLAAAHREARLTARFGDAQARMLVDDGGRPHVMMRLASGSLHDLRHTLSDGDTAEKRSSLARKTLRDVAGQLANMHDAGYVHCDVKPGNILCYGGGALRLADFGHARASDETERSRVTATIAFAPLEVLLSEETTAAHNDIWSLGMTLLDTLVSLDEAPVRTGAARDQAMVTAATLDNLLELRASILKGGRIDTEALGTSDSYWAPYLRRVLSIDPNLTLHVLTHMVAPPGERMSARTLLAAGVADDGATDAAAQDMAVQKLCAKVSSDRRRATCVTLDATYEAFVNKRV